MYFLLVLCGISLITSCAQQADQKNKKESVVIFHTSYGDMAAILYDETPKHKANFLKLVNEKYYDSTLFHRVIHEFMIQGGDPDSRNAQPGQQLGAGGPDYEIDAEILPQFFHEKGALSAARTENPAKRSSGSQFYIVQGKVIPKEAFQQGQIDGAKLREAFQVMFDKDRNKGLYDSLKTLYESGDMNAYQQRLDALIPRFEKTTGITIRKTYSEDMLTKYSTVGGAPHLDGLYTVFGKVISGLEVIDQIASQPTSGERPIEDIRMTVTVVEKTRNEIQKEYGYAFPK
jgi:cyclophilin family peptidyl-prolyl cis-trans isomerase